MLMEKIGDWSIPLGAIMAGLFGNGQEERNEGSIGKDMERWGYGERGRGNV